MNLVDSSGWLEYFTDGRQADTFARAIEDTSSLIVSAINIYDVFKIVLMQRNESDALRAIADMHQAQLADVTPELALNAAKLSVELKMPMADSLLLATARSVGATLWTMDEHFVGIAGVKFIAKEKPDPEQQ